MTYCILKRAIWCSHFLDFHFDFIQTGDTAIQHQFAQLRMQPAVFIADSSEFGMAVFELVFIPTQRSRLP